MNPPDRYELFGHVEFHQRHIVLHLTRIRGTLLLRDDQASDEKRVINDGAAKETAHLDVRSQVACR